MQLHVFLDFDLLTGFLLLKKLGVVGHDEFLNVVLLGRSVELALLLLRILVDVVGLVRNEVEGIVVFERGGTDVHVTELESVFFVLSVDFKCLSSEEDPRKQLILLDFLLYFLRIDSLGFIANEDLVLEKPEELQHLQLVVLLAELLHHLLKLFLPELLIGNVIELLNRVVVTEDAETNHAQGKQLAFVGILPDLFGLDHQLIEDLGSHEETLFAVDVGELTLERRGDVEETVEKHVALLLLVVVNVVGADVPVNHFQILEINDGLEDVFEDQDGVASVEGGNFDDFVGEVEVDFGLEALVVEEEALQSQDVVVFN